MKINNPYNQNPTYKKLEAKKKIIELKSFLDKENKIQKVKGLEILTCRELYETLSPYFHKSKFHK